MTFLINKLCEHPLIVSMAAEIISRSRPQNKNIIIGSGVCFSSTIHDTDLACPPQD